MAGEAYLQGSLAKHLDLKIGRQIVVWGKSDNLRVSDVLNPLDGRERGMVDIEDLRRPLFMSKLDYYHGNWNVSALAIHEIRFNKTPVYGSDYYPFARPQPPEAVPDSGGANTEYALALNGIFSGWDLALYRARFFDDQPYRATLPGGAGELRHSRLTMTGLAANIAMGNWLFKGEAARFDDVRYTELPGEANKRSDFLLGVEYTGFHDTALSLEAVNRHLHLSASNLADVNLKKRDEFQGAFRYQGDFMHSRLHLVLLAAVMGNGGGGFTRFTAAWDLADALTVTGGLIVYRSGNTIPFNAIGDNDRLFAELKYSF
ncbi:MAG: hypothetical protein GY862_03450 [Gammaproteobacteria bacterium]|nr:hypothetical protein [Gammaproteobacteria bacterium]